MLDGFREHPGRLYAVAAMLPLLPAVLILLASTAKNLARPAASAGGFAGWVNRRLGGDRVSVWGAYLSVAVMAVVAFQGIAGLGPFLSAPNDEVNGHPPTLVWPPGSQAAYKPANPFGEEVKLSEVGEWLRIGAPLDDEVHHFMIGNADAIGPGGASGKQFTASTTRLISPAGSAVTVGYAVDTLAALLFAVVGIVAALVFVFSLGYLYDERRPTLTDNDTLAVRRGRFGLYFAYLSMFVSAMLNLLIADNLLQLFMCWELVGACSYLLIGFYSERPAAASAATKAFVVNRIGDAGFLVAIVATWSAFGTLNISDLTNDGAAPGYPDPDPWVKLLIGLGLFLGAVGKSAQVPLQVWLPDAMAGPTPVSALIHAATMVAAGVYLCARCRWLFTPEVYLVIAYVGCVTMLLGATAACAQTDIKRLLAYSTVSQLGLMMLGIGVASEGPAAAVFHLITHAFFKSLLFLAAGAIIYALHHEQDLRRMGGLRGKMPVTAVTTLVGVLAISGFPLTSGWYSKEAILTEAVKAGLSRPEHAALAVAPFLTAGLTAYYMLRLWLLVFAGESRDPVTTDHAHDPPRTLTLPLCALAAFSVAVGWGWPVWELEHSYLASVLGEHVIIAPSIHWACPSDDEESWVRSVVERYHLLVEGVAGLIALLGFAAAIYRHTRQIPAGGPVLLANAWGFDAAYRTLIVRPVLWLASRTAAADKRPGSADGSGSDPSARRFDPGTLDGWLSAVGLTALTAGGAARRLQGGFLRGYVLALGLTVVGLLGMLVVLLP